jgi:hypothetical protein
MTDVPSHSLARARRLLTKWTIGVGGGQTCGDIAASPSPADSPVGHDPKLNIDIDAPYIV